MTGTYHRRRFWAVGKRISGRNDFAAVFWGVPAGAVWVAIWMKGRAGAGVDDSYRGHYGVARNKPSAIREPRSATRGARLIAKTAIVVRPSGVRPARTGPFHSKWSSHSSLRGSKSRVSWRPCRSMPAMFGSLCRLQHDRLSEFRVGLQREPGLGLQ